MVDNAVISRKRIRRKGRGIQHLCFDKGYKSVHEEQELIKRGYVLHIPHKKKKKAMKDDGEYEQTTAMSSHKKYSPKRWVVSVPTRGTTGLRSFSQDTKRKQRTTLDWCSCHAVSLSTERQFWDLMTSTTKVKPLKQYKKIVQRGKIYFTPKAMESKRHKNTTQKINSEHRPIQ